MLCGTNERARWAKEVPYEGDSPFAQVSVLVKSVALRKQNCLTVMSFIRDVPFGCAGICLV